MKRILKLWVVAVSTILVSACGGGGGGGGSSAGGAPGGGAPGSAMIALSSTNASAAAASVEDALFLTTGISGQGAAIPIGVVVASGNRFNLVDFLSTQLKTINSVKVDITPTVVGAITTSSVACSGGGSVGITLDDVDDTGDVSTGDTVTLGFNSCTEDGSTLNGSMSVSNLVFTQPSSTAYSFSGTMTLNNFTFTDGPDNGIISGTISFAESSSDDITTTTTISLNSLTATVASETLAITGLTATVTENSITGVYTVSSSGTINSNELGGTLTFSTPTALRGVETGYPSSGVLRISGSNSSVTLMAISSTTVRLDVDSNNDGVIDSTMNTTWAGLEAS